MLRTYIVYEENNWYVKFDDGETIGSFDTKEAAEEYGEEAQWHAPTGMNEPVSRKSTASFDENLPVEVAYRTPGKSSWKTKTFKNDAEARKWADKLEDREGSDIEFQWRNASMQEQVTQQENVAMKKPFEMSAMLRKIASKIDNSDSPVKDLVVSDIRSVLAAISNDVTIKEFTWDPGDERSYGSFRIVAETPYGELIGQGDIASDGSTEDAVWTLGGNPVSGGPDLGIPHYKSGNRAMARFEKVKDTEIPEILSEWISKTMKDMENLYR
jgi:hypothetical protein